MNKKVILGGLLCVVGLSSMFGFNISSVFGMSSVSEPLQNVYFTSGGDMQGSYHGLTVKNIDNSSALVFYEDAEWHNEAIAVKEYIVPAAVLEDIKTIFNKNKLARCEKASKSKFMVLDAATSSYRFEFANTRIHFSSTQNLSKENYAALKEIRKCVAAACQKGQLLPGLVLEKNAEGYRPTRYAHVKGQMAIKVVGYKEKTLTIALGNSSAEEKTISLNAKITELNNPNKIVAQNISDKTKEVSANYNDDFNWKLDKRLEAGSYHLDLGGYTTEFTIK